MNAPASINEDTIAPISIQRSAVDGADVTHFRISNVRHGTLYRDAGRTQPAIIGANLTEALVLSLFFSPDANYFSDPLNPATFAGFDVQGSTAGGTLGSVVTVSMPVNPVAESPDIPNATMFEDGGRVGIPVEPDPVDGSSVTHFKITRIDSGTLRAGAVVLECRRLHHGCPGADAELRAGGELQRHSGGSLAGGGRWYRDRIEPGSNIDDYRGFGARRSSSHRAGRDR